MLDNTVLSRGQLQVWVGHFETVRVVCVSTVLWVGYYVILRRLPRYLHVNDALILLDKDALNRVKTQPRR